MKSPIMKKLLALLMIVLCALQLGANVYIVNTTSDGTMLPPGQLSLRQAMISANQNPGYDSIFFSIPGPGPHTIRPTSQLPFLLDQAGVRIDGFSQPGAFEGQDPPSSCQMMIELSGSLAGWSSGIWIFSSSNYITGLVVDSFAIDGISIEASYPPGSNNNWIVSNFVGVDPTGTYAKPNGWLGGTPAGIALWHDTSFTNPIITKQAYSNFINTNLVSGNQSEGIALLSSPPDGDVAFNRVTKNYVGTDITGLLPIGNGGDGIYIGENSNNNIVDLNVVAANGLDGIGMSGFLFFNPNPLPRYVTLNQIYYNIVGMGADISTPMGNGVNGIGVGTYGDTTYGFAEDNQVVGNHIAYNGQDGIRVADFPAQFGAPYVDCKQNLLSRNNIYHNGLLGINLGEDTVTPNDPFDADSGANMLYNFPRLSNISWNAGTTFLRADLGVPLTPATRYIEYHRVSLDPSGHGEGMEYITRTKLPPGTNVISDTFVQFFPDDSITAIAIDSANWNTSEFSKAHHIRGPLQDSISYTDINCFGDSSGTIELSLWWGSGYYYINWSNGVQNSLRLTDLPAGTYSVTFTDIVTTAAGSHQVTLFEPPHLQVNLGVQDPSCMGCSDGAIIGQSVGGIPPYSYTWNPNVSSVDSATGLSAGNYCVTVTDLNNCIDTACATLIDPVGIGSPEPIAFSLWPNPAGVNQSIQIEGLLDSDLVRAFDILGNEIPSYRQANSIRFREDLSEGVYLIRVYRDAENISTMRLMVE